MELGVHLYDFTYPDQPASIAPTLARAAEAAEAAGLTWVSVMDHYFQMDTTAPAEHPMLEAYTALGYLAAHTSSVQLGVLVTGVTYRYPGLLAKAVSTLDVLSEGRAVLGLGAAWYEREHRGLGVPFPPTAERFERLEEALQIALQMWDPDENGAYEGRHYQLAETLCEPRPLSRPHPPILIGGSGERKTLRLVAQYADACNLFGSVGPEEVSRKLDVLRRHCDDVGRDAGEIRRTMLYGGSALASPDGRDTFVEEMADFAKVGIDQVIVMPPNHQPDQWIESTLTGLAPRLAEYSS
jgi:F420-dependent oxidoreductase-like protein